MSFETIEKGKGSTTVFVLHYLTGTTESMGFLLESKGIRLVFPQGQYPSGHETGGQSWFKGGMEFYEWSENKQAEGVLETTHELATFIKEIAPSGKRIVTGMSQGGDLSLMLAVYYPELVDMAIPTAGRLFPPDDFEANGRKLPAVHIQQGEADDIVPVQSAWDAKKWLSGNGFEATVSTYANVGHDYSEEMILKIRQLVAQAAE